MYCIPIHEQTTFNAIERYVLKLTVPIHDNKRMKHQHVQFARLLKSDHNGKSQGADMKIKLFCKHFFDNSSRFTKIFRKRHLLRQLMVTVF